MGCRREERGHLVQEQTTVQDKYDPGVAMAARERLVPVELCRVVKYLPIRRLFLGSCLPACLCQCPFSIQFEFRKFTGTHEPTLKERRWGVDARIE
jgi:hypothetical protein